MKKIFRTAAVAALLALGIEATAQRVGAYYANWTGFKASQSQYAKLTDVYWSFLIPDANGGIGWGKDPVSDPYGLQLVKDRLTAFKQECPSTVRKKISVGGDGITAFTNIMLDANKRSTFATNLANFVKDNNFDGVDIDWEYPQASEAANFASFLTDLNTKLDNVGVQLGKPMELSIAVFSTAAYGTSGITTAVINAVDYINIMAYDNNQETNHSSYAWATGTSVFTFWKNKVGASKLVMGLPFYGRPSFSPKNNEQGKDILPFKNVSLANVANDVDGAYYYNGTATIKKKAQFALTNGMLGVMFWELSQDRTDANSLLNVIDTEIKGFGCVKPEFAAGIIPLCGQNSVTLNPTNSSLITTGSSYVWKRNGVQVATTLSYAATSEGTYELAVTKTGTSPACVKTANVVVTNLFTKPNLGTDIPVCTGQTVDLDAGVVYTGVNYNWTKGGVALTPKTQKITGQSAGVYIVSLSDPLSKCKNVVSDTVNVKTGTLDVKGDITCKSGGTVNLSVLTSGGPYSWYDAQTAGTFLASGPTYSPAITATKSFWIGKTGGSISTKFGWNYNDAYITSILYKPYTEVPLNKTADFSSETRLKLIVKQKATIDSATVYINGGSFGKDGTVTFTVYKSDHTVFKTITKTVLGTDNGGIKRQRLPVGIEIDPGVTAGTFYLGYKCTSGSTTVLNGITEKNNGVNFKYPFTTDFIDIHCTVSKSDANFTYEIFHWYCGLYDVAVSTGASCPRVEVKGTLSTTCTPPNLTIITTPTSAVIDQGQTVSFTSTTSSSIVGAFITKVVYEIKQGSNLFASTEGQGVDFGSSWTTTTSIAPGIYTLFATSTDNKGASITKQVSITVKAPAGFVDITANRSIISPMPFSNALDINIPSELINSCDISIYNTAGAIVYSKSIANVDHISVGEDLLPGLYVLHIGKNGYVLQGKIVKQ